jgi:hypothetical protein
VGLGLPERFAERVGARGRTFLTVSAVMTVITVVTVHSVTVGTVAAVETVPRRTSELHIGVVLRLWGVKVGLQS